MIHVYGKQLKQVSNNFADVRRVDPWRERDNELVREKMILSFKIDESKQSKQRVTEYRLALVDSWQDSVDHRTNPTAAFPMVAFDKSPLYEYHASLCSLFPSPHGCLY